MASHAIRFKSSKRISEAERSGSVVDVADSGGENLYDALVCTESGRRGEDFIMPALLFGDSEKIRWRVLSCLILISCGGVESSNDGMFMVSFLNILSRSLEICREMVERLKRDIEDRRVLIELRSGGGIGVRVIQRADNGYHR